MNATSCIPVKSSKYPLLMQVPSTTIAIHWALSYLGCTKLMCKKPSICLDIDGTVLLNRKDGSSAAVCHFKSLVDACKKNDIAVHYITARPDEKENREWTLRQLDKCNLTPIDSLYMRPSKTEYEKYKFNARKDLIKKGFTILLSVGDQFADLSVEDPEKEIKDDKVYVGMLGDTTNIFSIKLPSEFIDD